MKIRSALHGLLGRRILAPAACRTGLLASLVLLAAGSARAATQYAAGAFTWDNGTTAKWASSTGGPYTSAWTSGNDAVFEGAVGTVGIAAAGVTAHNLTFNTTGYLIQNNTLTLNGTAPTISTGTGVTATVASVVAGSAGLTKAGGGTLTLAAANTYSGATTINAGTLALAVSSVAPPAGAVLHLDASTLSLANGAAVTALANLGTAGSSLDAAPTVTGQYPTFNAAALNGRGTIHMTGQQGLQTANNLGITGNADRSIFVVMARGNGNNNATGSMYLQTGTVGANNPFGIGDCYNTLYLPYTYSGYDQTTTTRPALTYDLLEALHTSAGNANYGYVNGTVVGPKSVTTTTTDGRVQIGYRSGDNTQVTGDFAEVLIYNSYLNDTQRQQVEAYLRAKWLPGSLPPGSLPANTALSIAAGATFDVSFIPAYTLGGSTTMTASGTVSSPATLKGGTTVNLGSRAVTLNFTPASVAGDTTHPALLISQGALTLNGAITVNIGGSSPLGAGTYRLISQSSGNISGTPTLAATTGPGSNHGLAANATAVLQVTGGQVNLLVSAGLATPTVALTRHSGTGSTTTYGDALSFDVAVTPNSPTAPTGLVTLKDGGASGTSLGSYTLGSSDNGVCTITPALNALKAGSHTNIVAVYDGDLVNFTGGTSAALSTQTVSNKTLTIAGAAAQNKTYDGTATATLSGTLAGVVSGDSVTLTLAGYFADAAAGTGKSVTSTSTIDAASQANYTLTQPAGLTADIVPKGQPLVPNKAEPFGFDEVVLLDGYLKHAQDLNAQYLLSLDVDRLVAPFRATSGLTQVANPYPGWENTSMLPGVACSFYLSGCSMLYASTGDAAFADRIDRVLAALAACQTAGGDGYLLGTANGRQVFTQIEQGNLQLTDLFRYNGAAEPYYAMEKLFSGLRDAYRIAGRQQALDIETSLGLWLERHMSFLSDDMMQRIMSYEYGGMNWVLSDLYVDTADSRFMAMSRRWWDTALYEPLSRGEDDLPGRHTNTQFPKISGLLASYPYTANAKDLGIAEFFWNRVVNFHSYVNGGSGFGEFFGPPGQLNDRLDGNTSESCNVFNMLRLTRLLFCIDPRPDLADYYERGLYNQVLAHQHPVSGRVCYYLPLDMGRNKVFDSAYDSFSCCVCSSMESHARHACFIYMRDAEGIYVNLFTPSELHWKARGVTLTQETQFPDADSVSLTIQCAQPAEFTLKLRHPGWSPGMEIKVNGVAVDAGNADTYVAIHRQWQTGDRVDIKLEMPMRTECMPDNPQRIAFFKGPVLMAGDLGPDTNPRPARSDLPLVMPKDGALDTWFDAVPASPLQFVTQDVLSTPDMTVKPFFEIYDRRYMVYWDVQSNGLADGTWTGATDSHWNSTTTGNWLGGVIAGGWNNVTFDANTVNGSVALDWYKGTGSINLNSGLTTDVALNNGTQEVLAQNGSPAVGINIAASSKNLTLNVSQYALSGDESWIIGAGRTLAVNSAITGTGGITMSGAGTAVLTGTNSYSGATTLSAGTLKLTSLIAALPNPPTTPYPGAVLHIDASTLSLADGAAVTALANLGSGGSGLNTAPTSGTPTFNAPGSAGALNGLGTIHMTGTQGLQTAGNLGITGNSDRSIFVVMRHGASGGNSMTVAMGPQSGPVGVSYGICDQFGQGPGNLYLPYTYDANDLIFTAPSGGTYRIYEVTRSGNISYGYLNGVLQGSKDFAINTSDGKVQIGYRSADGVLANGDLAEVLIYNFYLNDAQRQQVKAYLQAKWFGGTGSLPSATALTIAAGATLDVSAITSYTLGAGASLTACGTGTVLGTDAAAITGAAGGTVDLGARPVILSYDGAHPALVVSQGALTLGGNTLTVVVPGAALGVGVYTLVSTPSAISGTVNPTPSFAGGNGLVAGTAGGVSISGNNVVLTVTGVVGGYANWAAANGASADPLGDSNHNGVANGIEFFMGATPGNPVTPPPMVDSNGTRTWTIPYDPNAAASYKFQLSDDLSPTNWEDVLPGDPRVAVLTEPDRLRLALPGGGTRKFCRLMVTPTP